MRWVADECVAARLVALLRGADHDVVYIAEIDPRSSDTDILLKASGENRLLLTEDKDFGELTFRRGLKVPGVVLLRLDTEEPRRKLERITAAVHQYGDGLLGRYTVVEEGRIRSRALPTRA